MERNGMSPAPGLILSPEQKALRLVERLHGEAGQLARVQRGVERAVNQANHDLVEEGAQPSFTATLGAIANVLADHLARIEDPRQRAKLIGGVSQELALQVETRVEQGRW